MSVFLSLCLIYVRINENGTRKLSNAICFKISSWFKPKSARPAIFHSLHSFIFTHSFTHSSCSHSLHLEWSFSSCVCIINSQQKQPLQSWNPNEINEGLPLTLPADNPSVALAVRFVVCSHSLHVSTTFHYLLWYLLGNYRKSLFVCSGSLNVSDAHMLALAIHQEAESGSVMCPCWACVYEPLSQVCPLER